MTTYEPNERGFWGEYGGRFVPETLVAPLDELTTSFFANRDDAEFQFELSGLLKNYSGRPTPLYFARRLTDKTRRRADLSKTRRS
jgi:tryptophan synthase beta chain